MTLLYKKIIHLKGLKNKTIGEVRPASALTLSVTFRTLPHTSHTPEGVEEQDCRGGETGFCPHTFSDILNTTTHLTYKTAAVSLTKIKSNAIIV